MTSRLNRRNVIGGASAAAVGLPVLSACGSDSSDTDAASDPTSSPPSDDGSGAQTDGVALGATGEIPVGGCAVFSDQKVVVTQPSEGDFKAFTSVCTHQGCAVSASPDGIIPCGCHGSQFSIEDGSVVRGPAASPLAAVAIAVEGDSITLV